MTLGSVVLASCGEPGAPPPPTGHAVALAQRTPAAAAIELGATPVALDDHGLPTLLHGSPAMPALAGDPTSAARAHLARLAPAWQVGPAAMPGLEARGEVAVPGGTVVRLRQTVDGLAIDAAAGGELRVLVGKDGALIAASGTLISRDTPHDAAARFADDDAGAVARAVSALYKGAPVAAGSLAPAGLAGDGSRFLTGGAGPVRVIRARARKAWWPEPKQLTPAWIVEAYSGLATATTSDAYRTVIAHDGRILAQTNLTAEVAFTYRVFAETTGELHPFDGPIVDSTPSPTGAPSTVPFPNTPYPAYVTPNLVTVEGLNHPAGQATPDPWLAANRVETLGNNVEAYTDFNAPDGLSFGDFRATATAARTFDRTYDTAAGPRSSQDQQMAGITSLFFTVNWMHDFWYDAGFTEAAGNAQNGNLGRGGEDRDALLVEAQDASGRNNANMSTPGDGVPPRMQVFVWDNKDLERTLTVGRRTLLSGFAGFARFVFDLTGDLVVAADATAPASDACQALPAAVAGKIVLADRGNCSFKTKALNVQTAGGLAMILADNTAGGAPPTLGDDAAVPTAITIGVLSVTQADGAAIKADLAAGALTATLHRVPDLATDAEGTLDATVIAHEFGHYVHHRLSNCNTTLCGAMSEGWADFGSLLLAIRAGDNLDAAYPVGIYSTKGNPGDPSYFGIRRAPYSVTPALNGFTFGHMAAGQALPTRFPISGGNPATNNEVHAAGEVWASMLFEGYVALLKAGATAGRSFEDVRLTMRKYVVAGLLIAPTDNTPTEMRDAILTATFAASPADHDVLAAAFARRGFGSCAVSPARDSTTFTGITESFDVRGRVEPGVPTIASQDSCDTDSVLDAGETARVTVPISNSGPAALAGVAVTLRSATPGVHIAAGTANVGAIAAYGNASAAFDVSLDDGVTGVVAGDFTVSIAAGNACAATTETAFAIPLNADDKPESSATDTFDAIGSAWTPTTSPALWAHVRPAPLDGRFHATDDATAASQASLVSPPLTAGTGDVTVTIVHRFAFEATATQAFDGGVIEVSTDAGATWQDIATLVTPSPYNVTLVATGTNPLRGRPAFGNQSAGFDEGKTEELALALGKSLSGTTFQLRFRVGSDANGGAPGWDLERVALTGLTGTPFPTLVASTGSCDAPPVDAGVDAPPIKVPDAGNPGNPDDGDGGGGCQTGSGLGAGNAAAALLVIGLVRRRRRRRGGVGEGSTSGPAGRFVAREP